MSIKKEHEQAEARIHLGNTFDLEKLSKREKRQLIVDDAIARLELNYAEIDATSFFRLDMIVEEARAHMGRLNAHKLEDLKGIAENYAPVRVCILGLLFLAGISRFGGHVAHRLEVSDRPDDSGIRATVEVLVDWLSQYFDRKDLEAMEIAFVGGDTCSFGARPEPELAAQCRAFSKLRKTPYDRARLILDNLTDNKARFRPESFLDET